MTNEQIENYLNGTGGEELLCRTVWVAHISCPDHGYICNDGKVREPSVKVTEEVVQEVLTGYIENCFETIVDQPPRRKTKVCYIKVINDDTLYYPWEVYLTKEDAKKAARKKTELLKSELRERTKREIERLKNNVENDQRMIAAMTSIIEEGETK